MVKSALDVMGGDKGVGHFITKGDVVVIKPNVAFDKNPDLAATTQPDTLSAVAKTLTEKLSPRSCARSTTRLRLPD